MLIKANLPDVKNQSDLLVESHPVDKDCVFGTSYNTQPLTFLLKLRRDAEHLSVICL